jgi:RNA polymerase sigma-70 factor (TIGR02960 family)
MVGAYDEARVKLHDSEPMARNREQELLTAAREGDSAAFEELAATYRRELYAHCYRMLGSVQDAEDALQETLLASWRGLGGFEGRSSLRSWLYRVATNVCLRLIGRRPRRVLTPDYGPPQKDTQELGKPVDEPIWLEPWLDETAQGDPDECDPEARYLEREELELAFVAALQHLPGTQRAVLIMRDVLSFSAAEAAESLETTTASVTSALQRARKTVEERVPASSQREELDALGANGQRELVEAFVTAWERADVDKLTALLAEDARFTMPPLPAWFDGREDVVRFFADGVFSMEWRLVPIRPNGQLGFACYVRQPGEEAFKLGAINALSIRDGRIAWIAGFLDPALHRRLGLPRTLRERCFRGSD